MARPNQAPMADPLDDEPIGSRWGTPRGWGLAILIVGLGAYAVISHFPDSRFIGRWRGTAPVPYEEMEYEFLSDGTCTLRDLRTGRFIGGNSRVFTWDVEEEVLVIRFHYRTTPVPIPAMQRFRNFLSNPLSLGRNPGPQTFPTYELRILEWTAEEISLEVGRVPVSAEDLKRSILLRRISP